MARAGWPLSGPRVQLRWQNQPQIVYSDIDSLYTLLLNVNTNMHLLAIITVELYCGYCVASMSACCMLHVGKPCQLELLHSPLKCCTVVSGVGLLYLPRYSTVMSSCIDDLILLHYKWCCYYDLYSSSKWRLMANNLSNKHQIQLWFLLDLGTYKINMCTTLVMVYSSV